MKGLRHVLRISNEGLNIGAYKSEWIRRKTIDRPSTWWLDGIKNVCDAKSLELRDAMLMTM